MGAQPWAPLASHCVSAENRRGTHEKAEILTVRDKHAMKSIVAGSLVGDGRIAIQGSSGVVSVRKQSIAYILDIAASHSMFPQQFQ